jgi:hypothetical protein
MNAPVILITASSALADGWADSLGLQDALRLPDLAALNRASVAADSLVLLDLAVPPQRAGHATSLPALPGTGAVLLAARRRRHAVAAIRCRGLCPRHEYPDLLQQVFDTVQSGGTWVGRSIMQQLCAALSPAAGQDRNRLAQPIVGARAGRGGCAAGRPLQQGHCPPAGYFERTVKAHLTSVFQKFGVEDRLQLLLKLTGASSAPALPIKPLCQFDSAALFLCNTKFLKISRTLPFSTIYFLVMTD